MDNNLKSEDRRVRKTKKLMRDALVTLLEQKPLKNISVREISELADINRGTFYLHYKDVYDMVDNLRNEIFEKFNSIIIPYDYTSPKETLSSFFVRLFELLSENADFARVLIGKNGDAEFVEGLKNIIRRRCFNDIYKKLDAESKTKFFYFYYFIESGCIGICTQWLTENAKESPEVMANLTEEFILNGLASIE